jgi:hypothetical protein
METNYYKTQEKQKNSCDVFKKADPLKIRIPEKFNFI